MASGASRVAGLLPSPPRSFAGDREMRSMVASVAGLAALALPIGQEPRACRHSPTWQSYPPKTPSMPGYDPNGTQPNWQPAWQGPDGPLGGNGDYGVVLGRGLRGGALGIYSGKNDLWATNQAGGSSQGPDPKVWIDSWGFAKLPGAWVELGAGQLQGWSGSQDLCRGLANASATFLPAGRTSAADFGYDKTAPATGAPATLSSSTLVASDTNVIITTLSCQGCSGGPVPLTLHMGSGSFSLPTSSSTGTFPAPGAVPAATVSKRGQFTTKNNASLLPCDPGALVWPSVRTFANSSGTLRVADGNDTSMCLLLLQEAEPAPGSAADAVGAASRNVAIGPCDQSDPTTQWALQKMSPGTGVGGDDVVVVYTAADGGWALSHSLPPASATASAGAAPPPQEVEPVAASPYTKSSAHNLPSSVDPTLVWLWDGTRLQPHLPTLPPGTGTTCLGVTPDNYNLTILQGLTVLGPDAKPLQLDWQAAPHATASDGQTLSTRITMDDGKPYTLLLAAATTHDLAPSAATLGVPQTPTRLSPSDRDLSSALMEILTSVAGSNPLSAVKERHAQWWAGFWGSSSIALPPSLDTAEAMWHKSMYTLASASRSGKAPPSLYGPWVTGDARAGWAGAYTLNYDFQAIYYACDAANHPSLADPYFPLLESAIFGIGKVRGSWANWSSADGGPDIPGRYTSSSFNCGNSAPPNGPGWGKWPNNPCPPKMGGYRGANLPVDIGPFEPSRYWGTDLGMRSVSMLSVLPFIWRYENTVNDTFLRQSAYRAVREVAEFLESYATPTAFLAGDNHTEGQSSMFGVRHLEHSCNEECASGCGFDVDGMDLHMDLALARRVLAAATRYAAALGVDKAMSQRWAALLSSLPSYPRFQKQSPAVPAPTAADPQTVYSTGIEMGGPRAGQPSTIIGGDPFPNLAAVFPADVVTRDSPADDIQILATEPCPDTARNGLGFRCCGPSMECIGAAEAVTTLLLQSTPILPTDSSAQGLTPAPTATIRLFPLAPQPAPASFSTLRARGAFIVSASLIALNKTDTNPAMSSQVKSPVLFHSEAGGMLLFVNPWQESGATPVATGPGTLPVK
eukprot:gene227-2378_t